MLSTFTSLSNFHGRAPLANAIKELRPYNHNVVTAIGEYRVELVEFTALPAGEFKPPCTQLQEWVPSKADRPHWRGEGWGLPLIANGDNKGYRWAQQPRADRTSLTLFR